MKFTKITEMEQLVMKCIWTSDEDMSLPNVMVLLMANTRKIGSHRRYLHIYHIWLARVILISNRQGRTFKYHPLIDEADYRAEVLKNHIEFWDDGDINLFAKDLLSDGTVSSEQLAELKKALN